MISKLSRRETLAVVAGTLAAGVVTGFAPPVKAAANDAQDAINKFVGGKEPAKGRVKLDLPEIAENGNTVPVSLSVESPMTKDNYVSSVLVVADGNPRSGVATFNFTPASGAAEAHTRIRLAGTQNVIAVAKMSDGSVFIDSRQVKVTIGGCGG